MEDTYTNSNLSWTKTCPCGHTVRRYRGQSNVECYKCGQPFNAFGQRLARNWADNPSNWDDEVSDLDGYETAMLRGEEY